MQVTRRFWTVAGVGLILATWGVVTASPSLVVGAAGVGGWIVAVQYTFLRAIGDTLPNLAIDLDIDRERVTAEESTEVTLSASLAEQTGVSMRVRVTTPAGVKGTVGTLTVDELRQVVRHAEFHWPVAGEFDFEDPEVTFVDQFGLFTQTVAHGSSPTVVVQPRVPRNVHVGKGGDEAVTGFGEHGTGQTGSGLKPAEVRKYVPGDSSKEIDWKATARLAEPYVREFEVETDRETKLFIGHHGTMAHGRDGERKLEYARQLALAVIDNAVTHGDPVGCYTVGDEGITASFDPNTTDEHVRTIRSELLNLAPTATVDVGNAFSPADARQRAILLGSDDSEFATTLYPYFDSQKQYVDQVSSTPLFTAVNTYQSVQSRTAWSVFVTDDENETELRESVKLARELGAKVTVFLTPTVLFEEGALVDLSKAYERYVAFESLRHDLDSLEGVSAFEVGPTDRLSTILSSRSARGGQR